MSESSVSWEPYLHGRLIEKRSGYVVIVPNDYDERATVPISCALCDTLMRSAEDAESWQEFGCCDACAREWAQARRVAWKDGWRPTAEIVTAAMKERAPLKVQFDID